MIKTNATEYNQDIYPMSKSTTTLSNNPVNILSKDGDNLRLTNPAIYAMEIFQSQMAGEADRAGFHTEEDVVTFLKELRAERESI